MRRKYRKFFGGMAVSFSAAAVISALVFWLVLYGGNTQDLGSEFLIAEQSIFDLHEYPEIHEPEPQPVYEYTLLPEEEPEEYFDYEEDEYYYEEEPAPEPVEPRYMVALTFDDGPSHPTSQILDILEYHNARATFFVIGRRMNQWRDVALRAFEDGHEIAGHTFYHQPLVYPLTDEEILEEIRAGSAAIRAVTGVAPPRMVRPPAGRIESRTTQLAASLGYALILWDVDPLDWFNRDVEMIYRYIIENVRDGSIIVLHDTHYTTAYAMELVIPSLIEMGFEFVTVSELFQRANGRAPTPGNVYRRANIR